MKKRDDYINLRVNKVKAAIKAANQAARKSGQLAKMAANGTASLSAAKSASHAAFLATNHAAILARDSGRAHMVGLLIGRITGKGKFGRFCGRWDPYYN